MKKVAESIESKVCNREECALAVLKLEARRYHDHHWHLDCHLLFRASDMIYLTPIHSCELLHYEAVHRERYLVHRTFNLSPESQIELRRQYPLSRLRVPKKPQTAHDHLSGCSIRHNHHLEESRALATVHFL